MKKYLVISICIVFGLLTISPAFGLKLSIQAIKDDPSFPNDYAKVNKKESAEEVVISDSSVAYGPPSVATILKAYGVKITAESVKSSEGKIPSEFARVVMKDDGEKVIFPDTGFVCAGKTLNAVLEACGCHLPIEAVKASNSRIPPDYARIVEKDGTEKVVFPDTGIIYSAKSLDAILGAYKMK